MLVPPDYDVCLCRCKLRQAEYVLDELPEEVLRQELLLRLVLILIRVDTDPPFVFPAIRRLLQGHDPSSWMIRLGPSADTRHGLLWVGLQAEGIACHC